MLLRGVRLRGMLLCVALLACGSAGAQVSASATLVSDYRFRGTSLSNGEPAAQLSVAWEDVDGWYAGAFASSTRLSGDASVQLLTYLGYAHRMGSRLSWETGAQYAVFRSHPEAGYRELFAGLSSERLNGRIYYQPAFAANGSAVYVELNGTRAINDRVQLLGHVGWGRRDAAAAIDYGGDRRYLDARAGIGMVLGRFNLQVAGVVRDGDGSNAAAYPDDPGYPAYAADHAAGNAAWVVSVSRSW